MNHSPPHYIPEGKKVRDMFASIAGRYDAANSVLSFGIHHIWRKRLLAMLTCEPYAKGLDLATGTGILLKALSCRCETLVAADFCEPMLDGARKRVERLGLLNVQCVVADAMNLPFADEEFDLLTVAFGVRNFENLEQGLKEMHRVLKVGGECVVLEFGQAKKGMWSAMYSLYSSSVLPFLGGLLTGNKEAYTYLPETSKNFPCGELFEQKLEKLGFTLIKTESLSGGVAYVYKVVK